MTKIAYIAGTVPTKKKGKNAVSPDEVKQRAAEVSTAAAYVPYNSLTTGEMHLALMLQQAQILNEFYRQPQYAEAVTILENALYKGIHGIGAAYTGAADTPTLRSVAQAINTARRQTAPASGGAILGRSALNGVHIGEPIIPYEKRLAECQAKAVTPGDKARCIQRMELEKILNNGMEKSGLYLSYGFLPNSSNYPGVATVKVSNGAIAQQEIARAGELSADLVQQWLNVGMMRSNAAVAKLQPYGWVDTNALLMSLPEAGVLEIQKVLDKYGSLKKQKIGGADIAALKRQIAGEIVSIIRKYRQPSVGEFITAAVAIIGAITALLGSVSEFAKQLRVQKQDAFAAARGFGTAAFGPEQGDWDGDGIPDSSGPLGSIPTPLLIGGGVLAAWYLMK